MKTDAAAADNSTKVQMTMMTIMEGKKGTVKTSDKKKGVHFDDGGVNRRRRLVFRELLRRRRRRRGCCCCCLTRQGQSLAFPIRKTGGVWSCWEKPRGSSSSSSSSQGCHILIKRPLVKITTPPRRPFYYQAQSCQELAESSLLREKRGHFMSSNYGGLQTAAAI